MEGDVSPAVVEPAVPADAAAILAIHRRVLVEGDWFITEPDEFPERIESKAAMIREAARSENGAIFVARQSHLLVGWAQVVGGGRRRTHHVGRLEMMVDARARGVGVGRTLLGRVVAWAQDCPALHKLSLNVFAHNTRARALYRSFGFIEEGTREKEYRFADGSWRDDILMYRWVK